MPKPDITLLCGLTEVCRDNDRASTEILLKVNGMHGDNTLVMVEMISSVVLGNDLAVENRLLHSAMTY